MADDYDQTDSDDYNAGQWEERYFQSTEHWFNTERDIYARLVDLQGGLVPLFYGEARVLHYLKGETSPDPHYAPPAIVIEHIPTLTLEQIDSSVLAQYRPLVRSLIATVRSLSDRGIVHGDIASRNILVALPPEHSPRLVLFDFAFGFLRTPEVTEEDWLEDFQIQNDLGAIKAVLNSCGVRDSSPILSKPGQPADPWLYLARKEHWMKRWYDRVSDESTDTAPKGDEQEKPILWMIKPEVVAWMQRRDRNSIEQIYQPRPGSPDYA